MGNHAAQRILIFMIKFIKNHCSIITALLLGPIIFGIGCLSLISPSIDVNLVILCLLVLVSFFAGTYLTTLHFGRKYNEMRGRYRLLNEQITNNEKEIARQWAVYKADHHVDDYITWH